MGLGSGGGWRSHSDVARLEWKTCYRTDWSTVLCELELHYRIQRVLQQMGIEVEQRDVTQENRRLFGATFDAAPAVGASSSIAVSADTTSTAADSKVIKRPKVLIELD